MTGLTERGKPRLDALAADIRREYAAAQEHFESAVTRNTLRREAQRGADGRGTRELEAWVPANCGFSARTARVYMRLARNRQRAADLPSMRQALKALTPPPPRQTSPRPKESKPLPHAVGVAEVTPADTSNWETRGASRYLRRTLADCLGDLPRVVVEDALRRALAEHLGDLPPLVIDDALEMVDYDPEEREWLERFRGLMLHEVGVYVERWIEDLHDNPWRWTNAYE